MPLHVRGGIVRRMRLAETDVADDGSVSKRSFSGAGILVTPKPDAESRRTFLRFCRKAGIIVTEVETAGDDGTYHHRPDAQGRAVLKRDSGPVATVYQCVGEGPALRVLAGGHPAVASWEAATNVRPPRMFARRDDFAPAPRDASVRVKRELRVGRMPLRAQNDEDQMEMWDAADVDRHVAAQGFDRERELSTL